MFTGIIKQTGKARKIPKKGNQANITVEFQNEITGLDIGESIAVNGVCLTVVDSGKNYFSADVSDETLNRTNLGELKPNDVVNLESALKIGESMGGHLVNGHVDGIGRITKKIKKGKNILLIVDASEKIMRFIVKKGSIAIDGISLTIASCDENSFTISIIPHTESSTNLKWKKIGDPVNLENDIVGKYVEKFTNFKNRDHENKNKLSKEFLAKHGFS